MTRSSRCPNRDDRGQAVVTAGAGEPAGESPPRLELGDGGQRALGRGRQPITNPWLDRRRLHLLIVKVPPDDRFGLWTR